MKASEARTISLEAIEKKELTVQKDIIKRIGDAAACGYSDLYLPGNEVSEKTNLYLSDLGYVLNKYSSTSSFGTIQISYIVTWNE